jgi:AraC-like DNA-binding protein
VTALAGCIKSLQLLLGRLQILFLQRRLNARCQFFGLRQPLTKLLLSQLPFRKLPMLDVLGWMVDISPRTLKRQLHAAGTSYTGILDRVRFDTACDMLAVPEITIREIAHELGYSDTNNFVRSFRRMMGVTPGDHRRAQVH